MRQGASCRHLRSRRAWPRACRRRRSPPAPRGSCGSTCAAAARAPGTIRASAGASGSACARGAAGTGEPPKSAAGGGGVAGGHQAPFANLTGLDAREERAGRLDAVVWRLLQGRPDDVRLKGDVVAGATRLELATRVEAGTPRCSARHGPLLRVWRLGTCVGRPLCLNAAEGE